MKILERYYGEGSTMEPLTAIFNNEKGNIEFLRKMKEKS